jgi:hypothetical protein
MSVGEDADCVIDCFSDGSDYIFYRTKKEKSLEKAAAS